MQGRTSECDIGKKKMSLSDLVIASFQEAKFVACKVHYMHILVYFVYSLVSLLFNLGTSRSKISFQQFQIDWF